MAKSNGRHHRFQTPDPAAFVTALGKMLLEQDLKLTDLRLKRPTLEDVYLELVGAEAKGINRASEEPGTTPEPEDPGSPPEAETTQPPSRSAGSPDGDP